MKGLSIEEKAKAYEGKLDVARHIYADPSVKDEDKYYIEVIFPELCESEDERIKKEIIEILMPHTLETEKEFHRRKELCEWLEKQCKQKPADKAEPKFKVGDWIVTDKNHIWLIDEDCSTTGYSYRLISQNGKVEVGDYNIVDEHAHLWTIQDAKDGDVLVDEDIDLIGIFEGIEGMCWHSKFYYSNTTKEFYGIECGGSHQKEFAKPATKEQRDLLFKKTHEAGYTFDFEKKELKKLKFRVGDEVTTENEESLTITRIDEEGYWSNDLFICDFDSECVWDLVEQKPAWSEEDDEKFRDVIRLVEQGAPVQSMRDHYTNWLKSLKDRYTWKPSNEQMRALHDMNLTGNISYAGQAQLLIELYNNLKKL